VVGTRELQAQFVTVTQLIESRFSAIGEESHPCRPSLELLLGKLETREVSRGLIIETGSFAWGVGSTLLFDKFALLQSQRENCRWDIATCDIRIEAVNGIEKTCSSRVTATCDDSVAFLQRVSDNSRDEYDLRFVYLDSFDVDFGNPEPAAVHCLRELIAIRPLLRRGDYMLIDDTPIAISNLWGESALAAKRYIDAHGLTPGKGMYANLVLECDPHARKIYHEYQVLWVID